MAHRSRRLTPHTGESNADLAAYVGAARIHIYPRAHNALVVEQESGLLSIAEHIGERKPRFFSHAAASALAAISMSSVLNIP